MIDDDAIPIVALHRQVGIHDAQTDARIAQVVKPAIDTVFAMDDITSLAAYAMDTSKPPEARMLAGAKILSSQDAAAAERRALANVELGPIRAAVSYLGSRRRRLANAYAGLWDTPAAPGARGPDPRPEPYRSMVAAEHRDRHERERAEADEVARGKPLARDAYRGG